MERSDTILDAFESKAADGIACEVWGKEREGGDLLRSGLNGDGEPAGRASSPTSYKLPWRQMDWNPLVLGGEP